MKKLLLLVIILLSNICGYSQRVDIENEALKCKDNKSMSDLILISQLHPLGKTVYPIRSIMAYVDSVEYKGAKGDIWYGKISGNDNSLYCGVWVEIDESMTLFSSCYRDGNILKFCLLQRSSGVIKELDNFSINIKDLEVIETKNNKLLEAFTTNKGIKVVIRDTNKIGALSYSNAYFIFPNNPRL